MLQIIWQGPYPPPLYQFAKIWSSLKKELQKHLPPLISYGLVCHPKTIQKRRRKVLLFPTETLAWVYSLVEPLRLILCNTMASWVYGLIEPLCLVCFWLPSPNLNPIKGHVLQVGLCPDDRILASHPGHWAQTNFWPIAGQQNETNSAIGDKEYILQYKILPAYSTSGNFVSSFGR